MRCFTPEHEDSSKHSLTCLKRLEVEELAKFTLVVSIIARPF